MHELREFVSLNPPDQTWHIGTIVADDDGTALEGLLAYFGADDERQAVRVVVSGKLLGYVTRGKALDMIDAQSRDLGQAGSWTLPGISHFKRIELRCPVERCEANPFFADTFDVAYPPDCPLHPGHALTLAQA